MDAKQTLWAEIQAAVEAGGKLEDIVFNLVWDARRQRDNAITRIGELVEEIESHRDYWRGGREELEIAKTDACRAETTAKRLHKKIRVMQQGRREDDRKLADLHATFWRWVDSMHKEGREQEIELLANIGNESGLARAEDIRRGRRKD